ncbi:acyltransferase domain-containing protein [Amycolatopsis sp. H6(2020)]|nr:acyltransferase domain-containing protein [Amycolatopsis sp. H6(2020)]
MTPPELERRLIAAIANLCAVDPATVDVDRPLRDYGLGSREALELAGDLENVLRDDVPVELLWEYPTIRLLAQALTGEQTGFAASGVPCGTPGEPVAVIGIGCRLPGGVLGPDAFWDLLRDGRDGIAEVPADRWPQFGHDSPEEVEVLSRTARHGGFLDDIAGFDAEFFGITPREARVMDPQQRLLLEVTWEAFEHAGLAPERLRGSATGVFAGVGGSEYSRLTLADVSRIDAWTATGASAAVAANRLSYAFDLRGPSIAVDTACSSSLAAVHLAMQSLRAGECELAVAAGANLVLGPEITASFDRLGVTAPDGRCKAFDAAADGIGRGEGVGVVVLKPLPAAVRAGDRVLAVLRGSAVNSDGRSNGLTAPRPHAQQELLVAACVAADVDPAEIDYVEAHGTGTPLGDPVEAGALGSVLGAWRPADRPLLTGSVKTNLGHLEAAAGITGLIKVVLSLVNREIPASLHFTNPSPHIPFGALGLEVVRERRQWPVTGRPALAGVSAFGFGGTNVHVVVEQAVVPFTGHEPADGPGQFVVAAPSESRLREAAGRLAGWLNGPGKYTPLSDVEHSMARRAGGRCRAVVTAGTTAELVAGLRAVAGGEPAAGVSTGRADRSGPGAVWVFSGLGSQWAGMGRRLLAEEPAFAAAIDEIDETLWEESGDSVRVALHRGVEPESFEQLQVVVFAVQVALARLWTHRGAWPAAVIGHSLGEVAAAVTAGALSLEDGTRLARRRANALATTAGTGAMAVLELPASDVELLLAEHPEVDIAAFNSPGMTVVAGPVDPVRELAAVVERRGLLARMVNSTVAGHCRLVAGAADAVRADLGDLLPVTPETRVYWTALDDPRSSVIADSDYWAANVRNPVRFVSAVEAALADGYRTFVEVSPHPLLGHAIAETAAATDLEAVTLATLRRSDDERREFHTALGALLAQGHLRTRTAGELVDLPLTAWHHTRYWAPPVTPPVAAGEHPLLGKHIEHPGGTVHLWRPDLGTGRLPWLADHRVDGVPVLSAACYPEMAFAAASTALGVPAAQLELTDLVLYQPLPLEVSTPVTVTLEGGDRFTVQAKDPAGTWTRYADARVVTIAEAAPAPDPADEEGTVPMAAAELYERLRALGIDYGPAFRGVTGVRGTSTAARVHIGLPDAAPRGGYFVHPVLVDACLQGFAATLSTVDDDRYVPVTLGAVRVRGDVRTGVLARLRIDAGGTGSLCLVDGAGLPVLEIAGVVLRPVPRTPDLRDALLTRVWRATDPPATGRVDRVLVVAGRRNPFAGKAIAALERAGARAVVVSSLDRELLARHRPSAVVLLVPRDASGAPEAGQRAVLTAVDCVRELTALPGRPPRLWLVTFAAAAVRPGEAGQPGPAALRGLVRVLAFEQPAIRATLLDLDPDDLSRVAGEVGADADDDEVAWRAGCRYAARLERAAAPSAGEIPLVRPGAGYAITGGLGGLGLLLARDLAGRGAGRIVLNGRSGPGPAAVAVIEQLRSAGTEVVVVPGDIAEPGVAERMIEAAGDLRGIAHAAAVFDDRTVERLDEDVLDRTWRAKAAGAWRVHRASTGLALDWWLAFSSATALHGLPGQPAYASANAYVDALVALRRAEGLPATTVHWGTWAGVGAAAGIEVPWVRSIQPGEGLGLLADVVRAGASGVGAVRLNTRRLVGQFPDLAAVPFFGGLLGRAPGESAGAVSWADRGPVEARELIARQLAERVAAVLELPSLADDVPLTGLGVDSLLAVRIRNALDHDFGVPLPLAAILRGATLADLRTHVYSELGIAGEVPRPEAVTVVVPPRDAAERLVAAAWHEVLGVPAGVTQRFPALGGGDRQAERITELISARTGTVLTKDRLFAGPTVESMAAVVRECDRATGPVRVLRDSGARPPVFFFHPGGGDTGVFRQLVGLLDPEVPAYGFDRVADTSTVEQRVECHLAELRRVQAHGPYRLAGWSFGGFLAFEAAQQLTAAGEDVELLVLVDPILPLPSPPGSAADVQRLRLTRYQEFLRTAYGGEVELPYEQLAELDEPAQADLLVAALRTSGLIDPGVSAAILAHQRASYLDARLLERYEPSVYPGRTLFYSAASPVPGGLRDPRFDRTDPARGWDAVCLDLDLVVVPGHHLSLLDTPNVEVIAEHLDNALAALRKPAVAP